MARKAGVTAAETRAQLLEAAADVFAERGYDGASISAITRAAGLSSGAIYAHYASKADLFLAVLETYCRGQYRHLIGTPAVRDVVDFAAIAGSQVDRREPRQAALLLEAIVAAKRDREVAELVTSFLADGEQQMAQAVKAGQHAGTVEPDVGEQAFSRFVTMVGLGSALAATVGLAAPDHDDWQALIERLTATLRAAP
ncbi:MAG TPA: TetR family transcriptional regulator [Ilumatobacter sp.]|nr:TetR family transcriptional regulator [Ilumatobacter sp.]